MRLALVLLLLSFQAWGATYYVDCASGDDGNDGLTSGAPKLTVGSITISANDTIYIKAGTTCSEQISITVDGVTITNWPTDTDGAQNFATGVDSFDTSGKWVIDGGNSRSYGILATAASNVTISDGEIKNATENGISFNLDTGATTDSNFAVSRVIVHDIGPGDSTPSGETDYNDGTCFFARSGPSTGTAVLDGITYTDTVAYNCGKHGYDTRWRVLNVKHIRALAYNSGTSATGHGFSIHPLFETFTATGWTDADAGGAGTVYYRDRSSNSNQERRFINSTDNVILTQNTATPTTPGTNEWGVVAGGGGGACTNNATVGCLYVNIAGALTGKTFLVKRFPHGPFTYYHAVSHDNVDSQDANEGHGFSADDLSGPATYIGSFAYNNAGDGFKTLRGESIAWRGDLSYNNDGSGFAITSCTNCEFSNDTADSNGARGFYDLGITSENVDLTNNLATNDVLRGFSMVAGTVAASGYSNANNNSYGNANNGCIGVTGCLTLDPDYVGGATPTNKAGFHLSASSALRRVGTELNIGNIQDCENQAFHHPPDIGACGTNSGDIAADRTAATTRTAASARTAATARTAR